VVGRLQQTESATIILTAQTDIIHTRAVRFKQSDLNSYWYKLLSVLLYSCQ